MATLTEQLTSAISAVNALHDTSLGIKNDGEQWVAAAETHKNAAASSATQAAASAAAAAASENVNASVTTTWMTRRMAEQLREMNRFEYGGSGFINWGHSRSTGDTGLVGNGLWTEHINTNRILLGYPRDLTGAVGDASEQYDYPVINIDGVLLHIFGVGNSTSQNVIALPDAPTCDPLTDFDGSGNFTGAGGGLRTRQDLVAVEMWYEQVGAGGKDVVFPMGNVQFWGTSFVLDSGNSFATTPITGLSIAQSYSALGEWDTTRVGRGVQWSTLSDAEKTEWQNDRRNGLEYDPVTGLMYQWRYRVRVIEGNGSGWSDNLRMVAATGVGYAQAGDNTRIQPRGQVESATDFGAGNDYYLGHWNPETKDSLFPGLSTGAFTAGRFSSDFNPATTQATNGECYLIPVGVVRRRNQGCYHPKYNPSGCGKIWHSDDATNALYKFHEANAKAVTSEADAFKVGAQGADVFTSATSGSLAGGASENGHFDGLYHDVVYADDVEDLRIIVRKPDLLRVQQESVSELIQSTYRGWGQAWETSAATVASVSSTPTRIGVTGLIDAKNGIADPYKNRVNGWLGVHSGNPIKLIANNSHGELEIQNPDGTAYATAINVSDTIYLPQESSVYSAQPVQIVVIGNISNLPAAWQTGFAGVVMGEDDEGEGLPDLSAQTWKLPFTFNDVSNIHQALLYDNSAGTFSDVTGSVSPGVSGNTVSYTFSDVADCLIIAMTTKATPFIYASASPDLVSAPFVEGFWQGSGPGQFITEALTGQASTTSSGPRMGRKVLQDGSYNANGVIDPTTPQSHDAFTAYHGTASRGVKVRFSLVEVNGVLYQQAQFNALEADTVDSDWADDGVLSLSDNTSTKIDSAARLQIIGTARRPLRRVA